MKLVRRDLLATVSASLLAIFGATAQAAVGPTLKPTKLGQKIVFQGYIYICVKSKGKLIWKKGTKVVAKPATSKPSATPSSSPSATPSASSNEAPGALVFVASSSDVMDGEVKIVDVKPANASTFPVSVTRVSGTVIVVSAICTHQGCQIESSNGQLACPCHGSGFNAVTGAVVRGPAKSPLKKYTASENGGSIFILV